MMKTHNIYVATFHHNYNEASENLQQKRRKFSIQTLFPSKIEIQKNAIHLLAEKNIGCPATTLKFSSHECERKTFTRESVTRYARIPSSDAASFSRKMSFETSTMSEHKEKSFSMKEIIFPAKKSSFWCSWTSEKSEKTTRATRFPMSSSKIEQESACAAFLISSIWLIMSEKNISVVFSGLSTVKKLLPERRISWRLIRSAVSPPEFLSRVAR